MRFIETMKSKIILCCALGLSSSLLGCSSLGLKTKADAPNHPPVILGEAYFDFGSSHNQNGTNAIPQASTWTTNNCHLSLIWVEGTHTLNDPEPWCGDGEKYYGKFIFRVQLPNRASVDTPLESLYPGGNFNSFYVADNQPWHIEMADYNNDGQPDFNIVTYGSCVNSLCYFFTVTSSGKVEPLKVDGTGSLQINSPDRRDIQSTAIFGRQLTSSGFYNEFYTPRGSNGPELHWESLEWDPQQKVFHLRDSTMQLRR